MKKIAILGSTGSIGKSTLRVVRHLPQDLKVIALAAHSNHELLKEQIKEFQPKIVCIYDSTHVQEIKKTFPDVEIVSGECGLKESVCHEEVEMVVMAINGMRAIRPTVAALEAKKSVAIASKEVFVAAGEYISNLARANGVKLLPIDSEHSALFQCMEGKELNHISRVILTASGGPFRTHTQEELNKVTLDEALAHPTWNMGPKVTVDCSTLVNKGLEMIEARWLFDLPPEKIDVVIHPQSLVHSFVEFIDGSMLAQINEPDMIFPIQYALCYPDRKPGIYPPFDFLKHQSFTFYPPDYTKFPGLRLAINALKAGKSYCTFFNAANEALVERFLGKEIGWSAIGYLLEKLMDNHKAVSINSLEDIFFVEAEARREAKHL